MQTSIGFFDALFGKRTSLELPMPDGTTKTVQVTEKWLREMERQGKLKPVGGNAITVHTIITKAGHRDDKTLFSQGTEYWIVGQDIQPEEYERFKDEEGDIYAFVLPGDGGSRIVCVDKRMWMQSKKKNFPD